jgi:hypothetical protein
VGAKWLSRAKGNPALPSAEQRCDRLGEQTALGNRSRNLPLCLIFNGTFPFATAGHASNRGPTDGVKTHGGQIKTGRGIFALNFAIPVAAFAKQNVKTS